MTRVFIIIMTLQYFAYHTYTAQTYLTYLSLSFCLHMY